MHDACATARWMGMRKGRKMGAQCRLIQPVRQLAAQDSLALAPLASDDEHMAAPFATFARDKAADGGIGLELAEAVEVERGFDAGVGFKTLGRFADGERIQDLGFRILRVQVPSAKPIWPLAWWGNFLSCKA